MGRMAYVVLALSLPLVTMAQTMQSDWLAKWANARAYTLAVADAMPAEDYGYAPLDTGMMTFGEQLVHLAGNITWLSMSKLQDGERPPRAEVDPTDKVAVRLILESAFDLGAEALRRQTYPGIEQSVPWFTGEELTRRRVGLLLFDHVTHHRAQAIVYLRLRGVVAPAYVGW